MLFKKKETIDYYLCLILITPLILLFANQNWFFPYSGGPTDGWLNDLYFYGYGKIPQLFVNYKAARLSWIIKGWLFHQWFSPLVAYYILNLLVFYTCLIAFYYITKILFSRPIALLSTLAFATYSQFHSIISFEWDYHTHDAAANILLTLLFLLLAVKRPHWKLYLFLAGTTCVSAFQSPFVMILGLSVIFWYWYLNRTYAKHSLLMSTLMFGFGGVVMTVIYGAVNYKMGGPFLYFISQMPGHHGWPALSGYAYQASYWESFGHMLLYNKAFIVPLYLLVLSLIALFYFLKKKPEHPYRCAIVLCLVSFLLCWPIPILYQAFGWPVLSLPHWLMGMNQFVFLAMAAVFCVFLPGNEVLESDKLRVTIFLICVGIILCGALIFGSGSMWRHFVNIQIIFWAALLLILFLEKDRKFLYVDSIFILWFMLLAHGWLPLWIQRIRGDLFILQTIVASVLLLLPLFYLIIRSKILKRYSIILLLIVPFSVANVSAMSIPIALYEANFKCDYLADMYDAVMQGQQILARFASKFNLLLWFRYEDMRDHPVPSCVGELAKLGQRGIPMGEGGVFGAISVTVGAGGTTLGLNRFIKGSKGLLKKTLATLPDSAQWSQWAPPEMKANPHTRIIDLMPLMMLRTASLSSFPNEKFWLHVLPRRYPWAIMDHDLSQIQAAVSSFRRYGYYLEDMRMYHVQKGVISYYITTGYLDKIRD